MRRTGGSLSTFTLTASLAAFGLGAVAYGQVSTDRNTGQPRNQPQQPPPADRRAPLPGDNRVPTPPADQRVPLPSTGNRPQSPGAGQGQPGASRPGSTGDGGTHAPGDINGDGRNNDRRDDWRERNRWRYPRPYPGYYDYTVYDRNRYYDDGYRPYDPTPVPADRYPAGDVPATEPPAGDRARARDPMLPPEDLVGDEDQPPALRKALDASPQYREATAQLLRAWADFARAAEQVMQRLRPTQKYQRAMTSLREAEAKVVNVREQGANVPAVNLVSAAQDAMLARRAVRALEEQAINADPLAKRAKDQVDQAVDRRNKIRDDIASKLQGEAKPEAGQ
jgi:hypothetical protein